MQREGARVIASSKEYPGAIPDLLTVSANLIKERPDDVQKIVKTWWDVREHSWRRTPEKSEEIMAKRPAFPPRNTSSTRTAPASSLDRRKPGSLQRGRRHAVHALCR